MAFDITIGGDAQPDTGFDIIIGTTDPDEDVMLDFEIPEVDVGEIMLILVVRNGEVLCSDSTWEKIVDGIGGDGIFLDVYKRVADGTTGSNEGDVVSFLSLTEQELTGCLVFDDNGVAANPIEASAHGAFVGDPAPASPVVDSTRRRNAVISIWAANAAVDFTAPAGTEELDVYSSDDFSGAALLVATADAGVVGEVPSVLATASPAATGRTFALVLRYLESGSGHARREHDPDVTNPSGHASRIHASNITNPSGHARRTP